MRIRFEFTCVQHIRQGKVCKTLTQPYEVCGQLQFGADLKQWKYVHIILSSAVGCAQPVTNPITVDMRRTALPRSVQESNLVSALALFTFCVIISRPEVYCACKTNIVQTYTKEPITFYSQLFWIHKKELSILNSQNIMVTKRGNAH